MGGITPLWRLIWNVGPATKLLIAVISVCSLINWRFPNAHLSIILPTGGWSLVDTPWSILTSSFTIMRKDVLSASLALAILGIWVNLIEQLWGFSETCKYLGLFGGLATTITVLIAYGTNGILFGKSRANGIIAAPHSLLGASAVAMMQQRPDMNVRPIGILWHLPTKFFPAFSLTFSLIVGLLEQSSLMPLSLAAVGTFIGFVHLRFFKLCDGQRGDHSASFTIANMFPAFLRYPVVKITGLIFRIARLLDCTGRLKMWSEENSSGPATLLPRISLKPSSNFDAERRRALAMRYLDERLANIKASGGRSNNGGSPSKSPGALLPLAQIHSETTISA